MTTAFADYAAQQDARNTIQLNVRKWTLMLCDALVDNFKSRNHGKVGGYDAPSYKFYIVDKKTGELYKSASYKAPAKGVRYDLRIIEQREWLLQHADWAGGYLYAR